MKLTLTETDVSILSLINSQPNMRSVEIATSLKLDKRTIHRHLTPLEKERLVIGKYSQTIVDKQPVTVKKYRLTAKGNRMLKEVRESKDDHKVTTPTI